MVVARSHLVVQQILLSVHIHGEIVQMVAEHVVGRVVPMPEEQLHLEVLGVDRGSARAEASTAALAKAA